MNCHLVVPHLFGFPAGGDLFADLPLPALARLLSRGENAAAAKHALLDWLGESYSVPRQADLPVAPLTLALDGGTPGAAYWLRADPVHFRVDRDRVIVADSGAFALDPSEAAALTAALTRHFTGQGLDFGAPVAERWYLRLATPPDIVTLALPDAVGCSASDSIAGGAEATHWRRLQTEMQMVLHAHPVNDARESAGLLPVNGVWLWGGGRDPGPITRRFETVAADDPLARALARLTGAPLQGAASGAAWLAAAEAAREGLAVLHQLTGAAQYGDAYGFREALTALERSWFAPLLRALEGGHLSRLTVHPLPAPRRIEVTSAALRKFWRRDKPLAALAASPG